VKKEGRIHVRLDDELLTQVKEIAKRQGVTLTHLIDQYFRALVYQEHHPKSEEELGVDQV
jgi:predicted DNA binding CopG/RHH family protein